MDKELRKRLEEAAENFLLPYEKLYHPAIHLGFMQGAELGYKEAIAQAKEWIQKNVPIIHTEEGDYVRVKNVSMNKYLADFEAEMNKLWEEN